MKIGWSERTGNSDVDKLPTTQKLKVSSHAQSSLTSNLHTNKLACHYIIKIKKLTLWILPIPEVVLLVVTIPKHPVPKRIHSKDCARPKSPELDMIEC